MGWKWAGIDGKGYANTTYISEFHPQIPNLDFRQLFFVFLTYFMCVSNQNRVSEVLLDQSLTGVGYIDADWKVSTFKMNINLRLCTKSSKFQWKVGLTIKSWVSGLWVFFGKNHSPHIRSHIRYLEGLLKVIEAYWKLIEAYWKLIEGLLKAYWSLLKCFGVTRRLFEFCLLLILRKTTNSKNKQGFHDRSSKMPMIA